MIWVCVCVFIHNEREREREIYIQIDWRVIEMIFQELRNEWVISNCFQNHKFSFSSFFFFFLCSSPPHPYIPPTSFFHTEPSIYISCCPSWWLWEWLCWWWLLFVEMTHKHFVTLFQVFVHWTRLVSLPHVVGVMTTVLPSLLKTTQQGGVLLTACHQPQGLFWLGCLWFVWFLFCSFFLMTVVFFFLHFSFSGVLDPKGFLF